MLKIETISGAPVNDPKFPDVIELKGVNQSYGKKVVIKDLNLLVEKIPEQGAFIVILGESGCGKSTILRYIAGLQTPTSGEVLVDGKPVSVEDPTSMVFQQYSSLPWLTVLENVQLALKFKGVKARECKDRAMDMIKQVGLEGHEDKFAVYPILSGGQLQRVAIARSLVYNPSILLMDEPFGALDTNTRFQMQMMLAKIFLANKSSIILVTHDISEAVFLADWIYIMKANPGRMVTRINVDFMNERTRDSKRDPRFQQMVIDVEDTLLGVVNGK